MAFIANNWSLLVVVFAIAVVIAVYVKKYSSLSAEEQLNIVKEWLLFAVIAAEKEFASGTGVLKLHYVYDCFIERFPDLVTLITFEEFSKYVDEALVEMRKILQTNKDIEAYVEGLSR